MRVTLHLEIHVGGGDPEPPAVVEHAGSTVETTHHEGPPELGLTRLPW